MKATATKATTMTVTKATTQQLAHLVRISCESVKPNRAKAEIQLDSQN